MSLAPLPSYAAVVLCRAVLHHLLRPGAGGAYDRARMFGMQVGYEREKGLLVEVAEWLDDVALVLSGPTEVDEVIVLLEGMRPLLERSTPGVQMAAAMRLVIAGARTLGLSSAELRAYVEQCLGLEDEVERAREAFGRDVGEGGGDGGE